MRVEVVLNDAQLGRVGIVSRGEPVPKVSVVGLGAAVAHLEVASPPIQVVSQEERASTQTFIFVVFVARTAWLHRQGDQEVAKQLTGQFIKTDTRLGRVAGRFVDIQDILHAGDVGAIRLANAPFFGQPRLKFVFFRNWRTVSGAMLSTISAWTTRSANKRTVQRA